jgi:hypothetical protein
MEVVHPLRRDRDSRDRDSKNTSPHSGHDAMDDFWPLLEEDAVHGADQARARNADDVLTLLEENARLRGLVVKLSDIIIKSIAEQK